MDIAGRWPSPITISRGWARAKARPWNQEATDAFVRLDRGGVDFLEAATDYLAELTGAAVYSPAMYPSSTRVWTRAGYVETHQLEILERSTQNAAPPEGIKVLTVVDWSRIQEIDDAAFDGFWRMSTDGLKEAIASTKRAVVLAVGEEAIDGYAIVGAQWNVSYLQRIAVHPDRSGAGMGSVLLRAALSWGRQQAATTMVLNVRDENTRARRLYKKEGFSSTGTRLRILRYGP